MALIRWTPGLMGWERDPFAELERMRREMDRLLGAFFPAGGLGRTAGVFPAVNISEDDNNIYVRAELPGIKADDIEISIEDNSLIIKGERKIPEEGENVTYHRREREGGVFRRIISLPTKIDVDKVSATSKNGVLEIVLPKAPESKPKQIEVKTA